MLHPLVIVILIKKVWDIKAKKLLCDLPGHSDEVMLSAGLIEYIIIVLSMTIFHNSVVYYIHVHNYRFCQ